MYRTNRIESTFYTTAIHAIDAVKNIVGCDYKKVDISYQEFFEQAPQINPDAKKIKGLIGGMRVEMIEEPLMQQIRWLEKLVDELVRGRNIQF